MTTLQHTDDEFHFDFHRARTKFTLLTGVARGWHPLCSTGETFMAEIVYE
jgi:hypothetical protein